MADNSPVRKYYSVKLLVGYLLAGVTGFWGSLLAFLLIPLLNWLASKGVYFIDVGTANIRTNMDKETWLKVNSDSFEQVEKGVTKEQGESIDKAFIKAFDNFTVFKRVKKK